MCGHGWWQEGADSHSAAVGEPEVYSVPQFLHPEGMWDVLLMGERLWDVLIDLLPEKSPLLMQCTNAPFRAVSPFPAVNEHTLMTPNFSLEGGVGCACWKGLTWPHPWKCSRSSWMEFGATWSSRRCPCPWQRCWNEMIFEVFSNPNHFVVLKSSKLLFYPLTKYSVGKMLRSRLDSGFFHPSESSQLPRGDGASPPRPGIPSEEGKSCPWL